MSAKFKTLLERAAESGAWRPLFEVGLHSLDAAEDFHELCSLLVGFRLANQTAVRLTTTCILRALIAGIAIKLRFFDQGQ